MISQIPQHILLVPLMSQSHLIPFIDMAKQLAHHGLIVSIVMTPLNALRFNTIVNSNLKIHFLEFPFPNNQQSGLPQGCENIDSLPSPNLVLQFFEASNLLQYPLEKWLLGLDSKSLPNCIISDYCLPWTSNIAHKFNIPRLVFHGISCFTLVCSQNIQNSKVLERVASTSELFTIPNMPDRVEFTKTQLPPIITNKTSEEISEINDLMKHFKEAEHSAEGTIMNTFEELEPNYVKEYQKVVKKVWCIGPVSLSKFEMGGNKKASIEKEEWLNWLDSKKHNSVIYACFGSLCHMSTSQLKQLGLGLEQSNHPFIWVIRKRDYSEEFEDWFKQKIFEEKGLIIKGWAPQVLILSHKAIGGFITHCGWNSTLEGVSSGVPMITWPMFAEQFYNEKLIVQVLKIGVRIGVEVCVNLGEEEKDGILVEKEDIKRAIDKLMDEGSEGKERRRRARELGEMANGAVEEGGSSYLNMTMIVKQIMEHKRDSIEGYS